MTDIQAPHSMDLVSTTLKTSAYSGNNMDFAPKTWVQSWSLHILAEWSWADNSFLPASLVHWFSDTHMSLMCWLLNEGFEYSLVKKTDIVLPSKSVQTDLSIPICTTRLLIIPNSLGCCGELTEMVAWMHFAACEVLLAWSYIFFCFCSRKSPWMF